MVKNRVDMCEGPILKQMIIFAVPILLTGFVQQFFNAADVMLAGRLGTSGSDAVAAVGDIITGAFYQVSLNFTGQNVGAKKYDRVKRIYLTDSILSTVAIAVFSAFMCVFAKQLLGLYITDSSKAIKWGVVRILFMFVPLIFQGLMDVTAGALRGMGISVSNTIVSLICICGFRIVWCLTIFNMPEFHNPYILFSSYPISWVINYIFLLVIFIIIYNKQEKKFKLSK